jgi:hypothetical protein
VKLMDNHLVYVKTPIGDEAVRQSTRVVKRNLRMVLVQVDGKLSVAELSDKIGNPQMVEAALRELESDGFIAPTLEGVSVWEAAKARAAAPVSEFSTFGPMAGASSNSGYSKAMASNFSDFGKLNQANRPYENRLPDAPGVMVAEKREVFSDRKPLPWGRLFFLAILAALLVGVGTLLFYPYERLLPGLEAAGSQYLKMPVKIGSLQIRYLPKPALVLSNTRLGSQGDVSIETISFSPWSLLGSGKHDIQRLDIAGVSFPAERLQDLPLFASSVSAAQNPFSVRQITIDRLKVKAGDLHLDGLIGEILLRGDGIAEKAEFQTVDRSIRLSVAPSASGVLLGIEGFGWKPFSNQAISCDQLQAKGQVQGSKLLIHSFDTTLLGGVIKGSWMLDWTNGLAMAGDATLARLNARKVTAAFAPNFNLDGEMAGVLRLRSGGQDAASLWRNIEAGLDLTMTNGILQGIDLGEVFRRGPGSVVRGGGTKFDRLTGKVVINPRQISGRAMQLDAGMVVANGQFSTTPDQRVDADLSVTMKTSVAIQRLPVRVSGTLPDLSTIGSR